MDLRVLGRTARQYQPLQSLTRVELVREPFWGDECRAIVVGSFRELLGR
jgi:hypothetical protein